jgi:hypothetical protein
VARSETYTLPLDRRCVIAEIIGFQYLQRMANGEDLDMCCGRFVDDSVLLEEDLPEICALVTLWNAAALSRNFLRRLAASNRPSTIRMAAAGRSAPIHSPISTTRSIASTKVATIEAV